MEEPTDYAYREQFITMRDGIKIHIRDYGALTSPHEPVICLPGLTRNAADFHTLAKDLATDSKQSRRVVVVTYRGRGKSEYAPDWKTYNPITEAEDIIDLTSALDIGHATFIGTSRGGIIIFILAVMKPHLLSKVVLNDIGPEINGEALLRIRSMIKTMPHPHTWPEAVAVMKKISQSQFPDLSDEDWLEFARATYRSDSNGLTPDYDKSLFKPLQSLDLKKPLPSMWSQFKALAHIPVLVVHGGLSDLLSIQTVSRMCKEHPQCESYTVANEGHAPWLRGETAKRIKAFL